MEVNTVSTYARGILSLLGATAIVAIGLLVASESAAAKTTVCNRGCEARVTFRPKTKGDPKKETLIVRDLKRDGHSAVGWIQVFDRRVGKFLNLGQAVYFNSRGAGGRPKRVRLPLRNGQRVRYRACVGERREGVFFDCSRFRRDRA